MPEFVVSAVSSSHFPQHNLPEFVLVGPSNSGKSTLINSLAKKKISFVSKMPGKTRSVNFYDFEYFYLVDLPGYGYAKGSKESRANLFKIIDSYFSNREMIVGVFQVCSFHGLSEKDVEIYEYLRSRFHNYVLLINKMDKLSSAQQLRLKNRVIKLLNATESDILFISGKYSQNIVSVKRIIHDWI